MWNYNEKGININYLNVARNQPNNVLGGGVGAFALLIIISNETINDINRDINKERGKEWIEW